MKKFLIILLALAFPLFASAQDYFWYYNGQGITPASPVEFCKSRAYSSADVEVVVHSSSGFVSPDSYSCVHQMNRPVFQVYSPFYISRGGDGCTDPKTYNPATGLCELPRQEVGTRCGDVDSTGYPKIINTAGDCVQAVRADIQAFCKFHGADQSYNDQTLKDVLVQKDPNGNPIQPSDTAQFGCAVSVTGMNCTTPAPAETCSSGVCVVKERSAVCSLNVHHSGQVFNDKADPGVLANARCQSGSCLPPEPKQERESKPCTYVSTGQNSVACVSSEFFGKEGQSQCGTVNGVLTCKNDLPKPVSGGIRISTEVTSEPQPDGTTKQTKKDTRTDTKCTGMALAGCITASTTSTTVTIKDGNGNVISTTGSCTGKGCPDSNTNPDADGDGFGDCVGGDCGEGEGGASGSGVELPELEEVPEYADSAQGYFDRLSNAPIAKALKNISVPTGGSCNIGSVQVYFGTIDFNSFCTQAPALLNGMYYLFLAIWAWAAIRLFFTA